MAALTVLGEGGVQSVGQGKVQMSFLTAGGQSVPPCYGVMRYSPELLVSGSQGESGDSQGKQLKRSLNAAWNLCQMLAPFQGPAGQETSLARAVDSRPYMSLAPSGLLCDYLKVSGNWPDEALVSEENAFSQMVWLIFSWSVSWMI